MAGEQIGKYTEEVIKLTDLELDRKNPRIGEHKDQSATINAMLSRKSTGIDDMAGSIVRNGFLSLELPCVYPSTNAGKYIIAEGNRRITALKVLHMPELAQGSSKYQKFKNLRNASKGRLPTKVKCAVFKNAKECMPYVLMRHGLGNDGASLKRWNALEKRRVDQVASGKPHQGLRVIDFVLDRGNLHAKHENEIIAIDITNLERLTDSSAVRKLLGIKSDDCTDSTHGKDWLASVWQRIIEVILDKEHQGHIFSVKSIYTTDDQKRFIREILHEVHKVPLPPDESPDHSDEDEETESDDGGNKGKKKSHKGKNGRKQSKHQTTRQRKGLIEKKFSPTGLSPQKVIDIVDELKKLPVASHKNCTGVMFRVLTDLSIDHYIKTNRIKKTKLVKGKEVFLSEKEKRSAVIKHMKDNKALEDIRHLKPLEDTLDSKHPVSAESLNHYVHSSSQIPDVDALKTAWSNLQHIFDILWEK